MLVLTRRIGEAVLAGDVEVYVIEIKQNTVRLGFRAKAEVPVVRGELCDPPILKLPTPAKKKRRAA